MIIYKSIFCKAANGLLGEKALMSSLEPRSFQRRKTSGVEEPIKREYPEVGNARIDITFANSRSQKLTMVETRKLDLDE